MGTETQLILCQQTLILVSQDGGEGPTPLPFFVYLCSYQAAGSKACHYPQALKSSALLFWVPKVVLSRINKRIFEFWRILPDQKQMYQKSKPYFENESTVIFFVVVGNIELFIAFFHERHWNTNRSMKILNVLLFVLGQWVPGGSWVIFLKRICSGVRCPCSDVSHLE